jgi:hypothetical protein
MTETNPVQPHDNDPEDMLQAVNRLSNKVSALTAKVDISAQQVRRTRLLTIAGFVVVALAIIFGSVQYNRVSNIAESNSSLTQANTENAKQGCLNANESRAASLALWTTVLSYVKQTADPYTSVQLDRLLAWIGLLYQPRDCDDLSRKYTIPPPPVLEAAPPGKV